MGAIEAHTLPFPRELPARGGSGALNALANHQQVTYDPGVTFIANGAVMALLVLPVVLSGNFMVNCSFATVSGTLPILGLRLYTGAFTVNALAPVAGTYIATTNAGVAIAGGANTLEQSFAMNDNTTNMGLIIATGAAVGAFVAFGFTNEVGGANCILSPANDFSAFEIG